MKRLVLGMRLLASLFLLAALVGLGGTSGRAQEATPVAEPTTETEEGGDDGGGSYYVGAGCAYDAAVDQSTCTFVSYTDSSVPVDFFTVYASTVCAPVVDAGGSEFVDTGYRSGSSSFTMTLSGPVSHVLATTSYQIEAGGTVFDAPGDVIECGTTPTEIASPPTVVEEDPTDTGEGETGEEGETDGEGDGEGSDEGSEGDTGEDDDASGEGETPDDGGAGSDGTGGDDLQSEEGTPVADDGTGGSGPQTDEPVEAAALTSVSIFAYNCTTDPGGTDPSTNPACSAASGVEFEVFKEGVSAGTVTTDASGATGVEAEEGSSLEVVENFDTVTAGFLPVGNGVATFDPVAADDGASFVHVADSLIGRLQIVNGSCPTTGEERTEFTIIAPDTLQAQADDGCAPTPGAVFTITGGNLGPGGLTAVTDDQGTWRGFLPAGVYTVIDDSGASADIEVIADAIVAVIVVDYVNAPVGTLSVVNYRCTEGDAEGVAIEVDPAGEPGGACGLVNGEFLLEEVLEGGEIGAAETFEVGDDGVEDIPLGIGVYRLTGYGASQDVTVAENATTAARVTRIVLTGTAVVHHFWCEDPASNDVDPADAAYFDASCNAPNGGVAVTLYDGGGGEAGSGVGSGGGVTTFESLPAGPYSFATGEAVCAAFVEGADARGGFAILAGETTLVNVYTCAPPDDGNGNGNGNGNGDGDGTGVDNGDDTDNGDDDDNEPVTTLPQTGTRPVGDRNLSTAATVAVIFTLLVTAVGAVGLAQRRRAA